MAFLLALLLALMPTCTTEDSSNCYWDAKTHGNHQGRSFVDVGGEVFYL
jgi:hypothetical protein